MKIQGVTKEAREIIKKKQKSKILKRVLRMQDKSEYVEYGWSDLEDDLEWLVKELTK